MQKSYGEKLLNINVNSKNSRTNKNRQRYCELIDEMNTLREQSKSSEQKRLCSAAIAKLEVAAQLSEKAITLCSNQFFK